METNVNNTTDQQHDANNVLVAGFLYKIGDFTILFDEDCHKLKIITSHAGKHLKVRPKTDNYIEVLACR